MKLFYVLSFIAAIILCAMCSSCESQSGHRVIMLTEKVVVVGIPTYNMNTSQYSYKVKRVAKGVMDYINSPNVFIIGDTIMTRFN